MKKNTSSLPKRFPEYSLMYKNLRKKINELQNEQNNTKDKTLKKEIQLKINDYRKEMNKIESIFPDNFFENNF